VAGIIQIVARDIWDTRRGRLKAEPTVGEEREPADAAPTTSEVSGSGSPMPEVSGAAMTTPVDRASADGGGTASDAQPLPRRG
jgi:hypothetical protein